MCYFSFANIIGLCALLECNDYSGCQNHMSRGWEGFLLIFLNYLRLTHLPPMYLMLNCLLVSGRWVAVVIVFSTSPTTCCRDVHGIQSWHHVSAGVPGRHMITWLTGSRGLRAVLGLWKVRVLVVAPVSSGVSSAPRRDTWSERTTPDTSS